MIYLRAIALISMIVIYEDETNVPVLILPDQKVAWPGSGQNNQKSAVEQALTARVVTLYNLNHLFPGCHAVLKDDAAIVPTPTGHCRDGIQDLIWHY